MTCLKNTYSSPRLNAVAFAGDQRGATLPSAAAVVFVLILTTVLTMEITALFASQSSLETLASETAHRGRYQSDIDTAFEAAINASGSFAPLCTPKIDQRCFDSLADYRTNSDAACDIDAGGMMAEYTASCEYDFMTGIATSVMGYELTLRSTIIWPLGD